MVAALVLLHPELTAHTLLQLHHILKLVNQLWLISVIDLFYFPLDAGFALVPLHSTIKTVIVVAERTAEPGLILFKCVFTSRSGAPRHILATVDNLTNWHGLVKIKHLFRQNFYKVLFNNDFEATSVRTCKFNQTLFLLIFDVRQNTALVPNTFAVFKLEKVLLIASSTKNWVVADCARVLLFV
jgi:hypothetical protein